MKTFYAIVSIVALLVLSGIIIALPVWLLWNYCLVGAITGVNEIGIFQAWGLIILFNLFFKLNFSKKD